MALKKGDSLISTSIDDKTIKELEDLAKETDRTRAGYLKLLIQYAVKNKLKL